VSQKKSGSVSKTKIGKKYSWKPGARFASKLDAQTVGVEIDRIRREHGEHAGADDVLAEAKDPSNPLHSAFNWDDEAAAHEHRLETARSLLRSVHVVIITPERKEITARAFVSTKSRTEPGKHTYTSTEYAMGDSELRAEVLKVALRELAALRRKYAELSELSEVFSALDHVLKTGTR
jgi:hypothetical protein